MIAPSISPTDPTEVLANLDADLKSSEQWGRYLDSLRSGGEPREIIQAVCILFAHIPDRARATMYPYYTELRRILNDEGITIELLHLYLQGRLNDKVADRITNLFRPTILEQANVDPSDLDRYVHAHTAATRDAAPEDLAQVDKALKPDGHLANLTFLALRQYLEGQADAATQQKIERAFLMVDCKRLGLTVKDLDDYLEGRLGKDKKMKIEEVIGELEAVDAELDAIKAVIANPKGQPAGALTKEGIAKSDLQSYLSGELSDPRTGERIEMICRSERMKQHGITMADLRAYQSDTLGQAEKTAIESIFNGHGDHEKLKADIKDAIEGVRESVRHALDQGVEGMRSLLTDSDAETRFKIFAILKSLAGANLATMVRNLLSDEQRQFHVEILATLRVLNEKLGFSAMIDALFNLILTTDGGHALMADDLDDVLGLPVSDLPTACVSHLKKSALVENADGLGVTSAKVQRQIDEGLEVLRDRGKSRLHRQILDWQKSNPGELIDAERVAKIQQITDSIITADIGPISVGTFEWIIHYALEATRNPESPSKEPFVFTLSIGGDQVPPAYVETYVLTPLKIIAQLKKLADDGVIDAKMLPTLEIMGTATSQMAENTLDHEGNPIHAGRHMHNSVVTLARLQKFAEAAYPEVADRLRIHLFPEYKPDSGYRYFLGALSAEVGLPPNMFDVKGSVQGGEEKADPIAELFGKNTNIYPFRHLDSNCVMTDAHSLRFGAHRTEAPFHLIAMMSAKMAGKDRLIERIKYEVNSPNFLGDKDAILAKLAAIEGQIRRYREAKPGRHAQLGIKGMPATYYHQSYDLAFDQLPSFLHAYSAQDKVPLSRMFPHGVVDTTEKGATLKPGQIERKKAGGITDNLLLTLQAFGGASSYAEHLESFVPRYLTENPDTTVDPYRLAEELGLRLVSRERTLKFLHLDSSILT